MVIRFLIIILAVVSSGCAHKSAPAALSAKNPSAAIAKKPMPGRQIRSLSPFNTVDAKGIINISLHTNYKKPEVILRGDPRDLAQVVTKVSNKKLTLVLGKGSPDYGGVTAEIHTNHLVAFNFDGQGQVSGPALNSSHLSLRLKNTGKTVLRGNIGLQNLDVSGSGFTQIYGVNSRALRIKIKDKARVQIKGMVNLTHLNIEGSGWLGLYWINSPCLEIVAKGSSQLNLAGFVEKLHVELWGTSQFKGRYLRARRAFVRTHDRSLAEISAVNRQHTLARDASDIFYYNIAETQTNFMAYDGSVLDMRELYPPFLEEYNRYNKHIP